MMVVNTPLIRPYFLGGVGIGGIPLDSHDFMCFFLTKGCWNTRCFILLLSKIAKVEIPAMWWGMLNHHKKTGTQTFYYAKDPMYGVFTYISFVFLGKKWLFSSMILGWSLNLRYTHIGSLIFVENPMFSPNNPSPGAKVLLVVVDIFIMILNKCVVLKEFVVLTAWIAVNHHQDAKKMIPSATSFLGISPVRNCHFPLHRHRKSSHEKIQRLIPSGKLR